MSVKNNITVKLPIEYDQARLVADLEAAQQFSFGTHPLKYHDGSWQALNLIYSNGETHYTHEGDLGFGLSKPEKTEVLAHCPYFEEILDSMPGEIIMARLSAIPAGGRVLRHYDPVESADFQHFRIHIPIVTHDKVHFKLAFRRQVWRAGELWYGDFTFPHSIINHSDHTRVHMIIDLKDSNEIRELFPPNYFSDLRTEKRAKLRQKYKDYSWYVTRLEQILGRDAASLQKKRNRDAVSQ